MVCQICGKQTTQINYAHLKPHGITSSEYREMFPDAKMRVVSQKTREAVKQNMINRNKSDKARKKCLTCLRENLNLINTKKHLKK